MLSVYPACFYKEENGYSVIFPDLNNGLATCGETLEEAFEMAVDCMAGYLYELMLDNEPFPQASEFEKIDVSKVIEDLEFEYSEAFVNMVAVDVKEYARQYFEKTVEKTVVIPQWLDEKASEMKIDMTKAFQEKLLELVQA